jgi:hypothetical protein
MLVEPPASQLTVEPDLFTAALAPAPPSAPHRAPPSPTAASLTRPQILERIMSLNPTAGAEFLSRFPDQHLASYLDHLVAAQTPRGRAARWVRPAETPGILVAEPRD